MSAAGNAVIRGSHTTQPSFATKRARALREQENRSVMSTNALDTSIANPYARTSNLVELTLVWGVGRDASVIAVKRCRAG